MAHDLIVRGGTVYDGAGAQGVRGDVAVDGTRITAIGILDGESASREVDATGLAVTPGFVDLHTHLDAQVGWDPFMTSSSWQGVTTVLMGNCGVTFAPAAPEERSYLAEMMESVEDIPREAILSGLPWDWETYPEYLDSVERMAPALNVVGMVGHCAVRYHVMGERALTDEQPTDDELSRMADIAADAVAGGAVGFSTSRLLIHTVPDGRCVPGTFAPLEEHEAIAEGMNRSGGGIFQAVLDFYSRPRVEFELLSRMAELAGDVVFTAGPGDIENPAVADRWSTFLGTTWDKGGRITAICGTRPGGMLLGLVQVPPVLGERWRELMELPSLEARVEALRDDAVRRSLIEEGKEKGLWQDPSQVYPLGQGELPEYSIEDGDSVAQMADAAGVHPIEIIIDRLLETEGRELFNSWIFHRNRSGLAAMMALDHVYPGAADTGAHAGVICDADHPTHYLSHWARDRGITSLPDAIRRLTSMPAGVLGLKDRGTLVPGAFADVNVFDPERLEPGYPEYVHDFPGGKGRLRVGATGYAVTMVNGQIVTEQGANTGARPGRVLREFSRS